MRRMLALVMVLVVTYERKRVRRWCSEVVLHVGICSQSRTDSRIERRSAGGADEVGWH